MMLAQCYCRAHSAGRSSQEAPHLLHGLSNCPLSSRAALGQCNAPLQGAILEEQGRLKHGCETCVDGPRVAGVVESQHVAVNLGGWGWLVDLQLCLKQHEPVDASSPGSQPVSQHSP